MKFTSIKQIPKEAIEMIDDVQWWTRETFEKSYDQISLGERLGASDILDICNNISENGIIAFYFLTTITREYFYIEPRELEDKTYGINLYKKIHGEKG